MTGRAFFAGLGTIVVTLACGIQPRAIPTHETAAITPPPPVSPAIVQTLPAVEPLETLMLYLDIPGLTLDGLKNTEYRLTTAGVEQSFRLTDGLYQQGNDPTAPGFMTITLNDLAAFGDLNGDRAEDAVVILSEHQGGTGVFVSIAAVLNRSGLPQYVDSVMVDDRAIIKSLSIQDGMIILEAVVHGANDPGCCPSLAVTRTYILEEGRLVER